MASGDSAVTAERQLRAVAHARNIGVTPMKARRVIDLIRGRGARDALAVLQFAPQAASSPVSKVLASAMANAQNNLSLDPDTLVVSKAYVDEGPTLKRFRERAQGRAYRIRKRTSHITVEVESLPERRSGGRQATTGRQPTGRQPTGRQTTGRQSGSSTKATQTRSAR